MVIVLFLVFFVGGIPRWGRPPTAGTHRGMWTAASGVLTGKEVIPELVVVREVPDVATHLRI
jgi:hypothetical protein